MSILQEFSEAMPEFLISLQAGVIPFQTPKPLPILISSNSPPQRVSNCKGVKGRLLEPIPGFPSPGFRLLVAGRGDRG